VSNANVARTPGRALTEIEMDVLVGAALGETAAETAKRRERSEETVKTERRVVLAKLGARNMANAIALAFDHGLLRPRTPEERDPGRSLAS
jgi:DNA-binding NarL/FixJ family response regulator